MIYNGGMSIPDYKVLLNNLVSKNFVTKNYENIIHNKKHIILRHDIDILPSDAINLAEIENSYNYKAYYFFLVNTDFYNVNSQNNKKIIRNLVNLGHQIGLHYDDVNTEKSKNIMDSVIEQECKILEDISQQKISCISFHRPSKELFGLDEKIAGRLHTYMPEFFSKISYVSDSRGEWNYGHPLENDFYDNGTAAQVLIHPEWWNTNENIGRDKQIKLIYSKLNDGIKNNLENNLTNFSSTDFKFY